jgi:hypothetical protein
VRAAAALVVAAAAFGTGGTAPRPTTKYLLAPFVGGRLSSGLHVSRTRRGFCWVGSLADSGRSDAWRCLSGNLIHDPCFSDKSKPGPSFVVCPSTPWSRAVVKIVLTRKLPLGQANPAGSPLRRAPWAIEVASGKKCLALTGATGQIAGRGVSYGCVGGGYLLGTPRRAKPTWTIFYAAGYKARRATRVTIAEAWW